MLIPVWLLREVNDMFCKNMQELAEKYGEAYSHKLIDVTHAENGAWVNSWMALIYCYL